ncbi:AcrR family transcriptional regulator [Crossiella equi]|uniref:AcrR family transcriptional regulator n=1 Tax=Crossiella equi TaxID=130796 RepID=A0ABS5AR56_9PSEU|nr:TetR/AcrR family transcriptional regulator [Crossiella equi]MBP2479040.1 AcrR family transcriptional regulator [Crossiella equi]
MSDSSSSPGQLRADAARNETKVLCAARAVFAEQGEHALIEDIAARAGVGVGTVYRRFGNKRGLLLAVITASMAELRREVTELELGEDALAALTAVVTRLLEHGQRERHLILLVAPGERKHPVPEDAREIMHGVVGRLLARARRDGQVRPEVTVTTLVSLLRGLMIGVLEHPDGDWRTGVDVVVRGIRSGPTA